MKAIFDQTSFESSKLVTKSYSTSFSSAVRMLAPSIREDIYSIYGFVRFADEIVDSFHGYDQHRLLDEFERDYYRAMESGISLNPILNSFQLTVKKYNIPDHLVQSFLSSMKMDLHKSDYTSVEELNEYIYGSADVVGLMCLKVFVKGDNKLYEELKPSAMKLGSAFQKVNFLRDIKADVEELQRSYFPGIDFESLSKEDKAAIVKDIEADFAIAYEGIMRLPRESKFGVYAAYRYYNRLLRKLKETPSEKILNQRIRISNPKKVSLLARSFVTYKLGLL